MLVSIFQEMGLHDCRGWLGESDIAGQAGRLETLEKKLILPPAALTASSSGNLNLSLQIFQLAG